ncbi:MAG: SH3 domain-containing protein [Chloroflexi bacterium]|nr:SH3 domain-containing protein [Chloroflexota bacterium]
MKRYPIWLALGLALIASGMLSQLQAQSIEVEAMCGGRLSISWNPPPGAGGYYFNPQGEGGGRVKCSDTENKCIIEGLKPGKDYDYWLDRVTRDGLQYGPGIRFRGPTIGDCPDDIAVTPTPRPPADTCAHSPTEISVKGFQPFSTQCRRVGAASVGNAGLIAQGILDAIDVWGNVGGEIQVCFRRHGRLYFLDASTSPRLVSDLPGERINGMTCGRINRAGTVALLQGGDTAGGTTVVASESKGAPEPTGPTSTTSCQLVTTGFLSLRAGPSVHYARILSMPRGRRLIAQAKIGDWFMVNYQGQLGWAHREYLAASPGCDGLGEAGAIILPPMMETPAPQAEEARTDSVDTAPEADPTEVVEPADETQVGCQVTTVDIVNLRAGPGLEYDVYAEVPYETVLNALEITRHWFQVEYEGIAGWISRQYVFRWGNCDVTIEPGAMSRPEPPAPETEAPTKTADTAQADEMHDFAGKPLSHCNLRTGDIINLRQGPGLEYSVLAEIPYRTNLSARERLGEWFKVEYQVDAGWVHIDYVFRSGACG